MQCVWQAPDCSPVWLACASLCLLAASAAAQSPAPSGRQRLLTEARAKLAARDLIGAQQALAEAAEQPGSAAADAELARVETLHDALSKFWSAVERGAGTLDGLEELVVGDQRVAVVEYERGVLVLRVAGQNKRYTRDDMPPKLAMTLAGLILKADAPQNKVFTGALLLIDPKGDRKLAREHLMAAAAAGVDVKPLLAELDVEPPPPPIEIPVLPPAARAALAPDNWSLREATSKGRVRKPLDSAGKQNSEGRLELRLADTAAGAQVVCRRQLAGDFRCRVILQDVPAGQSWGLFAAGTEEAGFLVPLPEGTSAVELSRVAGALKCLLNGKEVELQATGDARPRLAGMVGLTLPAGGGCTVAAFELLAR